MKEREARVEGRLLGWSLREALPERVRVPLPVIRVRVVLPKEMRTLPLLVREGPERLLWMMREALGLMVGAVLVMRAARGEG